MDKSVCIYHRTDLDGHCAGALVKLFVPDVELAGYDYADKITADQLVTLHEIDKETRVFMVDFSLQPFEEMLKLKIACKSLIWCDHHKTAIEDYVKYDTDEDVALFGGYQSLGLAGCELTWKWFKPKSFAPKFVKYLGRYDVWDHKDLNVMPFQYGMRAYDTNPMNMEWGTDDPNVWERIFNNNVSEDVIVKDGAAILRYVAKDNKVLVESTYFMCHVGQLKCIAVNKLGGNASVFDVMWDEKKYDAMLIFGYTGTNWRFSLYTTKTLVDVGSVAKCFGGGGHAQAAGWVMSQLPFYVTGDVEDGRNVLRIPIPE